MRAVPDTLTAAWRSGDFTGSRRPMGRITVQRGANKLFHFDHNLYSSYLFNNPNIPKELPNLKSISWERSTDAEIATATITLWNTRPLPLGEQPSARDLDLPGWYTPTRGVGGFSSRWGHEVNEWLGLLLPDNIVRTYEGYGFDPNVCPEDDPFLVRTGTWLIDDVDIDADKTIVLSVSDFGRLLVDHSAMRPVVPPAFEPLRFHRVARTPGIKPPQLITPSVGWQGPSAAPDNVVVTPGDRSTLVAWDALAAKTEDEGPLTEPPATGLYAIPNGTLHYYDEDMGSYVYRHYLIRFVAGPQREWYFLGDASARSYVENFYGGSYTIVAAGTPEAEMGGELRSLSALPFFNGGSLYELLGYRVYVNGNLQPFNVPVSPTPSVTIPKLTNGVVYDVTVAGIYQVVQSRARNGTLQSTPQFFSPRTSDAVGVQPGTVESDTRADGSPVDGWVRWEYTGDGTPVSWNVICYHDDQGAAAQVVFASSQATVAGTAFAELDTGISDLHNYNIAVFPTWGSDVGPGGHLFSALAPAFYGSSVAGAPPDPPAGTLQPTVTDPFATKTVATSSTEKTPTLVQTSNFPYHGTGTTGPNGEVRGHQPADAVDGSPTSYWLSVGNSRPDVGYAFEWFEGAVSGSVMAVKVSVPAIGSKVTSEMMCYVSVKVGGAWVQHEPGKVIPYDPEHPLSKNGGNIPYVTAAVVPIGGGLFRIDLPQSYPGATRVRVTFSNLFDSGIGPYPYRAALADFKVLSQVDSTVVGNFDAPDPELGAVTDTQGNTITKAEIIGGAGEYPGTYRDYTEIVKLLCAWAGFFWPEEGFVMGCDGSQDVYSFGNAPFNLGPNIDPVLGGDFGNGGRVWGDFELAGTGGVADLTPSIFDKKPLMEGINHVKEILGFLFHIDEDGGVMWRSPNIWSKGNWILGAARTSQRTAETIVIDERVNLVGLQAKLSGRNVREKIFIGTPNAKFLGVADGWNPNHTGLRRVAGWTDQNFGTQQECQLMAELIQLRQMFAYRNSRWRIPANPAIQINDQVRIVERVTAEGYLHYVRSITSNLDMAAGEYTFEVTSHWLGEDPFEFWVFDPNALSDVTRNYLENARGVDLSPKPALPPVRKKVPSSFTFDEFTD